MRQLNHLEVATMEAKTSHRKTTVGRFDPGQGDYQKVVWTELWSQLSNTS